MKRFLFYLGHPAHYHNVVRIAEKLMDHGHQILLVARAKDVLFELLEDTPFEVIYLKGRKGASKLSLIASVGSRELKMRKIALRFKPHLMIGTDIVITHVGKWLKIPAIVLNEDDAKEVPLLAHYGFKYATAVFSPNCCNIEPYDSKKVGYEGYHELAYLHPKYFVPNATLLEGKIEVKSPYFILRFAQLTAHHDEGRKGIDRTMAHKIINLLKQFGRVYITSERKLESEFENYRIQIHPKNMHHALYYASMYIGDSQTMAAEAAVLGTPSLRFNDFVGKLGYLEELEHRYQLTFGIPTNKPEALLQKIEELLTLPNLQEEWEKRRQKMLQSTIDVASFMTWYFENYPDSTSKLTTTPDWVETFK